jgi:tetratricopeptide (TPR) repeat protein
MGTIPIAVCLLAPLVCAVTRLPAQAPESIDYGTLMMDGRHAIEAGKPDIAATFFQQVFDRMQVSNASTEEQVNVLIALSTARLDSGNLSQGERLLMLADQLLAKEPNPLLQAQLLNNWASVHLRLGRYAQAQAESKRAFQLVENMPAAAELTPYLLDSMAVAELYQGQYPQALQHQQDAIDRWLAFLPNDHPDLIKGLTVMSTAQYFMGKFKEARNSLEMAITSAKAKYGRQSPDVARLLRNELIVLNRLGLKKEVRARQRELSQIAGPAQATSDVYTRSASNQIPAR